MITKVIKGCPKETIEKRKNRIQEALDIKFDSIDNPVKYVVDKLNDGTEVYFIKPGKEYSQKRAKPNPNDMSPNIGTQFEKYKFADIWAILCEIYNKISLDNYKKLSVILYRLAYLLDFDYVNGKLRFMPNAEIKKAIDDIQQEVINKKMQINILAFINFIDVLSWNEDVKYHVTDSKPDFSNSAKRKNGRINTVLSCISIPILFQEFVNEVLKNKDNKENINFSIIINVVQKFAKTRGIHPQSNKELIELLSPYLTDINS